MAIHAPPARATTRPSASTATVATPMASDSRVLGLDDVEAELPVRVGRRGGVRELVERVRLVDQAHEVRDRAHPNAIVVLVEERR